MKLSQQQSPNNNLLSDHSSVHSVMSISSSSSNTAVEIILSTTTTTKADSQQQQQQQQENNSNDNNDELLQSQDDTINNIIRQSIRSLQIVDTKYEEILLYFIIYLLGILIMAFRQHIFYLLSGIYLVYMGQVIRNWIIYHITRPDNIEAYNCCKKLIMEMYARYQMFGMISPEILSTALFLQDFVAKPGESYFFWLLRYRIKTVNYQVMADIDTYCQYTYHAELDGNHLRYRLKKMSHDLINKSNTNLKKISKKVSKL